MTARFAALLALLLSGCVEFRPATASTLGDAETVRVTLTSRREVTIRAPRVVGDSLIGQNEATGARVAIATARIARMEARHVPQHQDLAGDGAETQVVAAVAAAGLTLAGALLILLFDLP